MDEAGYGPNLGPLLITVTKWRTPGAPETCDFYRCLASAVSLNVPCDDRLHLADSKIVNTGKGGFARLEATALALTKCLGWKADSFQKLWDHLSRRDQADSETETLDRPPWHVAEVSLPVVAEPEAIERLAENLRTCMDQSGVVLETMCADLVEERRFNDLMDEYDSKGLALSRLAFRLLRSCWSPDDDAPALVVGDKHGGRNRYDDLLAEVLEDQMIFRVEEGRSISRYRVGATQLWFQVGGEQHLPVAAASVISKYMRELSMDLFNQFWARYCPEVKPTRGYPNDAKRFWQETESARAQLKMDDRWIWRNR